MRCAVLGDPVGHSLSPVIHRAAYAGLGLEGWQYDAERVPAGTLAEFVAGLDPEQWRGLSLTMPLKREAPPLLDTADEWVRASGAANTVVLDPDGTRHGLNTDITGTLMLLGEHGPVETALVLGAGATAASVLLALVENGLTHATLAVRDPDRATETVRVVTAHRPVELEVVALEGLASPAVDLVVSTVPVSAQVPEVVAATMDAALVFDVVYDPWPTPVAAAAERSGRAVITGLDLLLAQALNQVVAMTGRFDVPAGAMRRAAEAALVDGGSA